MRGWGAPGDAGQKPNIWPSLLLAGRMRVWGGSRQPGCQGLGSGAARAQWRSAGPAEAKRSRSDRSEELPPGGTHRGAGAGGGAGGGRPLDRDQSHLGAARLSRAGHSRPVCRGAGG